MGELSHDQRSGDQGIKMPKIDLPKGGGSIKGIGETFQPDLFAGTGSYSIPIPITEARGFEPDLSLNYNSGSGNGVFGIGIIDSLSRISLRTEKGIPKYDGTDIYMLDGQELVLKNESSSVDTNGWKILVFVPRVESQFTRIEQHISPDCLTSFWKTITNKNVVSFFGTDNETRIYNPEIPSQIFQWLIERSEDIKGNKIIYTYKSENDVGHENDIWGVGHSFNNKYIQNIKYGNFRDSSNREQYVYEVLFDYGEYVVPKSEEDKINPYQPIHNWEHRADAFSSFLSGFEIRTCRLCHSILLFHHFEKELGEPCLVKSIHFKYEDSSEYEGLKLKTPSLLSSIQLRGYKRKGKKVIDSYDTSSMPEITLEFSKFIVTKTSQFHEISVESKPISIGLNGNSLQMVDLYGEGIAGLLYSDNKAFLYYEPKGNGDYNSPETPQRFPVDRDFLFDNISLEDIDGNGELELVVKKNTGSGYYPIKTNGRSDEFQAFESFPTDFFNPKLEHVGLSNNGKVDLFFSTIDQSYTYPSIGKSGYATCHQRSTPAEFPIPKEGTKQEFVGFANIFGDGLSHRVRITNGSIECWPCLGYGNFGQKIVLGSAPIFENEFDASRLLLADIDGSGTTDLVYVHHDRVKIYLNHCGNFFSEGISVILPETYSDNDTISFSDVRGNGTTSLVFTKRGKKTKNYYYDFVEGPSIDGDELRSMKPYLLVGIDNGFGARTRIQYCSSTKFYLEDKNTGNPWKTKLPFPVQVVESVTFEDMISGNHFTNRFKYHEGYYDPVEREFRGFGYVESWDSENFDALARSGKQQKKGYVPPIHTKKWYNTGADFDHSELIEHYRKQFFQGDPDQCNFPGSHLENKIFEDSPETVRQAYVALKGKIIRAEVYADDKQDHPDLYLNPYAVEESNYQVRLLQKKGESDFAVFLVTPKESITYNYERNPKDPNIQQTFALEVDDFGNVQRSCQVFLPRRDQDSSSSHVYDEQKELKSMVVLKDFVAPLEEYLFCKELCGEQKLEVLGIQLGNNAYFKFEDIASQVGEALKTIIPFGGNQIPNQLQCRQLSWKRMVFWDESQKKSLPNGSISKRGLLHHQETAAFTKKYISEIFENYLTEDKLKTDGGYHYDSDSGYWWNRGLVQYYYLPEKPERFFMPCKVENSFVKVESSLFAQTTIFYDPYYLSVQRLKKYVDKNIGHIMEVEIDYYVQRPRQIKDINNNTSQVLYDPLGHVIATTLFGAEKTKFVGGMTLYPTDGKPAEYAPPKTTSFEQVINEPEKYLQGATTFFYYDLHRWKKDKSPACFINLVANRFWKTTTPNVGPHYQILIAYSDGMGRELEKKQKTSSGFAFIRMRDGKLKSDEKGNIVEKETSERWQVSGRTVYNNKGKPYEKYLPYFSNTPKYEDQADIPGPPPTIFVYDALEREIKVHSSKGFFSKVTFTPWEECHFDKNDTLLDAEYYQKNYPDKLSDLEKKAIEGAEKCYNTPTSKIKDNAGNTIRKVQANLGNVRDEVFEGVTKGSSISPKEVRVELITKGYLQVEEKEIINSKGRSTKTFTWLTKKFAPYSKGFSLKLNNRFKNLLVGIEDALRQGCLTEYYENDILGRTSVGIDSRIYYADVSGNEHHLNFQYKYGMDTKNPLRTDSIDAGVSFGLVNIFGDSFWSMSARRFCEYTTYDRLQRKTRHAIKEIDVSGPIRNYAPFHLVESYEYGDYQPDPQNRNLNGQLFSLCDTSGIHTNHEYSIKEEVLHSSRRFLKGYEGTVDWNANPQLEKEVFTNHFLFNAVGDAVQEISPNGTVLSRRYNQAAQLDYLSIQHPSDPEEQPVIEHASYDAKGQRTAVHYGNGVKTKYEYEKTTQRLLKINSIRQPSQGSSEQIQLLDYCYDPFGNTSSVLDKTAEYVFNKNSLIKPCSEYEYDPLYRLISANGRQHIGISKATYKNNSSEDSFKQCIYGPSPSTNSENELENYVENYFYDDAGNLIAKKHRASSLSWTKETPVEKYSNRLSGIPYDEAGNLSKLKINDKVRLEYDFANNLVSTGSIIRPNESDDKDHYLYDSQNIRTRKITERMTYGASTSLSDKKYLGNYELVRSYAGKQLKQDALRFERQSLRVMDGDFCVAIVHLITVDKKHKKNEGQRYYRFQMSNDLNSISIERDIKGKLISYEEYFPYGGTAIITGTKKSEVKLKDYRYSGKERDDSTGLYYYGDRYYMPWMGKWLKPDPSGTTNGMNVYAFVGGNPTSRVDIEGDAWTITYSSFTSSYSFSGDRPSISGVPQGQEAANVALSYTVDSSGSHRTLLTNSYAANFINAGTGARRTHGIALCHILSANYIVNMFVHILNNSSGSARNANLRYMHQVTTGTDLQNFPSNPTNADLSGLVNWMARHIHNLPIGHSRTNSSIQEHDDFEVTYSNSEYSFSPRAFASLRFRIDMMSDYPHFSHSNYNPRTTSQGNVDYIQSSTGLISLDFSGYMYVREDALIQEHRNALSRLQGVASMSITISAFVWSSQDFEHVQDDQAPGAQATGVTARWQFTTTKFQGMGSGGVQGPYK